MDRTLKYYLESMDQADGFAEEAEQEAEEYSASGSIMKAIMFGASRSTHGPRGEPLKPTPEERDVRLPEDSAERKEIPIVSGVLDYFPDAIAAVARLSKAGNDKHNPGQPLHWSRSKSDDHAECIGRHLIDRGKLDENGVLHDIMLAWRALANLQVTLERINGLPMSRGSR